MRLLLIQHDDADAEFLEAALRGQEISNLELTRVADIAGAITALSASEFDVMLLDLEVPDASGLDAIDAVKGINDETAIVVLSSQDDESLAASILSSGAQDYLVKWEGQGRTILRSIRHSIERKRAELRLSYLAQYDALTGIPNRQFFNDQLRRATANARRDSRSLALLLLDLDEFKIINDTLGHDAGDLLLKGVAERLQDSLRSGDVVSRIGGDEFAILLEGIHEPREVEAVALGLLESLSKPYQILNRQVDATASLGISLFPNDHTDVKILMKHADIAMYRAKEQGGNTHCFFHTRMQAELLSYHELARDIRLAMERQEFHIAFQPKVNVHTKQLQGLEALARWTSPTRGEVSPTEFINVAEDSGLIIPLGSWVLDEVCRTIKVWRDNGLSVVPVSVNVSARQFQQPVFHRRVGEILDKHSIPPSLIELELTEGLVMSDVDSAQAELAQLKEMGFRISIDDFGTGYSCLNYLRKFPIDVLKIDKSFVADIEASADGQFIIEAIISLARSLRLETVAEGVETHGQLAFLIDHGCHVVQGFLLGRPMSRDAVEPLLVAIRQGDTDSTAVVRALSGAA